MKAHIRVKTPDRKDYEGKINVRRVSDINTAVLTVLDKGPDYLIDWTEINVLIVRE